MTPAEPSEIHVPNDAANPTQPDPNLPLDPSAGRVMTLRLPSSH